MKEPSDVASRLRWNVQHILGNTYVCDDWAVHDDLRTVLRVVDRDVWSVAAAAWRIPRMEI